MRRREGLTGAPQNPMTAVAPRSHRRMYGEQSPTGEHQPPPPHSGPPPPHSASQQRRRSYNDRDDEGVEVVLGNETLPAKVVDSPEIHGRNQNVFRGHPSNAPPGPHRPRPVRAPSTRAGPGGGPYPYPPPSDYHHPDQVPYTQSNSFDEGPPSHYPPRPPPSQHYSPQVHYPTPGQRYPGEDVNVISPNHKPDPYAPQRPPMTPRSRQHPSYYHYPPASPVGRGTRGTSPQRRNYGIRRPDSSYSRRSSQQDQQQQQQHAYHPDDGTFNEYGERPPLVQESSFDSDHNYVSPHVNYSSHPPGHYDHRQQFYGEGSWNSFESSQQQHQQQQQQPPPHFDDYRYYGYQPDSPYSSQNPYSPAHPYAYNDPHYHHPYPHDRHPYEEDEHRLMRESGQYHPDKKDPSPPKTRNGILLPKAASEIDFEVTQPPMEPVMPPSEEPVCDSPAGINTHDVLCGRGGGTNSQIGNRRFRKLVQEFQPTYLLARRKEKPLLARTIVLIIRKRGGRFLKKDDETGELYEVGDGKAEAKTSQALREGLDVRATKSAANNLMDKKKKTKKKTKDTGTKDDDKKEEKTQTQAQPQPESKPPPTTIKQESKPEEIKEKPKEECTEKPKEEKSTETKASATDTGDDRAKTPPREKENTEESNPSTPPHLPKLQQDGGIAAGVVHPHSPEAIMFRKRRRMRSGEGCLTMEDKLFPDFCPPRADLARTASPTFPADEFDIGSTTGDAVDAQAAMEDYKDEFNDEDQPAGCTGIAMSIMTGTGSFCLGPTNWRRK